MHIKVATKLALREVQTLAGTQTNASRLALLLQLRRHFTLFNSFIVLIVSCISCMS